MKKRILILSIIFTLLINYAAYANAEIENAAYNLIVPLEYNPITIINGDMFVTKDNDSPVAPLYSLYRFDGTKLLSDAGEISFHGDYIFVTQNKDTGVYSRDLELIVPSIYKAIFMKDATHCIAVDGKEVVRPGYWRGDMYLYDLTSGKIVEELGYGKGFDIASLDSEAERERRAAEWKLEAGGPVGVSVSMDGDGWAPLTYCKAYTDDGELLLDFLPYCINGDSTYSRLYYGCRGLFLYGYSGSGKSPEGMNYIFTGRGRLIARQAHAHFIGLNGGKYIFASGNDVFNMKNFIMDRDGNIIIPEGTFDSYGFNYTTSTVKSIISDDDGHIIVSKDGKYGIITLPDIELQPSLWAKQEVKKALDKNLVPEDMQLWWKDSCTREEFCRMLSLSVKEITGKNLRELSAGMQALSFSDSDNPDVLAASALGIVKGVGNNRFAPNRFITREQAAVILSKTAAILDIPLTGKGISFADKELFSDWANSGIDAVSRILCGDTKTPLMQGMGANRFGPQDYCTVEQAAITMLKLTEAME